MSVKRRITRKGGFHTLFANVARKKRHRAATTATPADFEGDVPSIGIARALVVILIIHMVAIAGIFFHSHWLDDDQSVSTEEKKPAKAMASASLVQPAVDEPNLPKIRTGDSLYTVGTGDTYEGISNRFGIDESDLRHANDNIPLRQGRYLRIPPKTITAVESPAMAELRGDTEPVRVSPDESTEPAVASLAGLIDTDAAKLADARQAGTPIAPAVGTDGGAASYQVKPGDTFWAIAQKHGTSVDKLMATNKIDNPRHLKIGMSLVIPE